MRNPKGRIWQASKIWQLFKFDQSFATFLKLYFKKHKKYGKQDRAQISQILYSFLRVGANSKKLSFESSAHLGLILTDSATPAVLRELGFDSEIQEKSLTDKIEWCNRHFDIDFLKNYFSVDQEFSEGIERFELIKKLLSQPPVFIRILQNKVELLNEFKNCGISFETISETTLKLPADTKLHQVQKSFESDFYIQDLASQMTANFMNPKASDTWWDACCGAGGKSLLLHSKMPGVSIIGSDARELILKKYTQRLKNHGVNSNTKVLDLYKPKIAHDVKVDGIVLDAPCSGSGTWGRNPESILSISNSRIISYSNKQRKFCESAIASLKTGGYFTYITCSIFKAENEDVANYIKTELGLRLVKQGVIHSTEHNSDYLFAAQFRKEI